MAITVSALGVASQKTSTAVWTPFTNIALAEGNYLILCFAADYHVMSANYPQWNSKAMTSLKEVNWSTNVHTKIFGYYCTGAATGNVVISATGAYTAKAATLYIATGLQSSPLDAVGSATGSSTSPASQNATTTFADELLIGVIGREHSIASAIGNWDSTFSEISENTQSTGTSGSLEASNITIMSGTKIVSTTGTTYNVGVTGATTSDWAAAFVSLKRATAQAITLSEEIKLSLEDYKKDTFEWGSHGNSITGSLGGITWLASADSGSITISTAQYASGTRSMDIYHTSGTDEGYFNHTASSGYYIDHDLRKDTFASYGLLHGNGTKLIFVGYINNSGTQDLYYYDGSYVYVTGTPLTTGTWVKLSIRNIDWTNGYYDIYVDNIIKKASAVMATDSGSNGKVEFALFGGGDPCHAWIDNVRLYNSGAYTDIVEVSATTGAAGSSNYVTGSESLTLSEYILKSPIKNFIENITISSLIYKFSNKKYSSTISVSDSTIKKPGKSFGEELTLTSSYYNIPKKLLSATITLTANIYKVISKAISETINITGIGTKLKAFYLPESIILSESIKKLSGLLKQESIIISSSIFKAIYRKFSENIESAAYIYKNIITSLLETVNLSSIITKANQFIKSESITLSGVISKIPGKLISNTISAADYITKAISKSISETISSAAEIVYTKVVIKVFSEVINISSSILKTYVKLLAASISLTENIFKSISRYLSSSITLGDTLAYIKSYIRVLAEIIYINSSLLKTISKIKSETISLSSSKLFTISKTITDSITLSSTLTSLKALLKEIAETINISSTMLKNSGKLLSSSITITANIIKSISKSISESITIEDILDYIKSLILLLSESITVTQASIYKTINKLLMENITISSIIIKLKSFVSSEAITLEDNINQVKALLQSFSESITLTASILFSTLKTIVETISISDTRVNNLIKYIQDTISITGTTIKNTFKILHDNITFEEGIDLYKVVALIEKELLEIINLTDYIFKSILLEFAEILPITHTINKIVGKFINESISLVESSTKTLFGLVRDLQRNAKFIKSSYTGLFTNTYKIPKFIRNTYTAIMQQRKK